MAKKFISLSKLSIFLDNLKKEFASITHTHTATEVGALPIGGGALTGDKLHINSNKGMVAAWTDTVQLAHFTDDDNYLALSLSDTQADIKNAARLVEYEGGNWKATYNLYGTHNKPTAADIGAATADHIHTAAEIGAATVDHNHTASEVGAKPVKHCIVGQNSSTTTNPWYKFASTSIASTYNDHFVTFKVSRGQANDSSSGILSAHIRQGKTIGTVETPWLKWEYANEGIDPSKFVLIYKHNTTDNRLDAELWAKIDTTYTNMKFEVLVEHNGGNYVDTLWTLHNKLSAGSEASLPSGWTQVVSALSTIQNPAIGPATLLYNGSWSSGSITVADLSKYKTLRIRTSVARNIYATVLDPDSSDTTTGGAVAGGSVSYNTKSNGTIVTSLFLTRDKSNTNKVTLTKFEVFKIAASTPTADNNTKTIYEIWGIGQ